ncbi:Disease resistance protein RML1B, partial [Mucuna pruriens]
MFGIPMNPSKSSKAYFGILILSYGTREEERSRPSIVNPMAYSHKVKYVVLVSLLLVSVAAKEKVDSDSAYPVTSLTCPNRLSQLFTLPTPPKSYHVFVSFRGRDVRGGFLSHLIKELSQKHIDVFVDKRIPKGDEIPESLLGAIEGSLVSVIIFSRNFVFSRWCLLEVEKIVDCRKRNGQIVLPVFYKVDPSNIRHPNESYPTAFAEHGKKYSSTTIQTWISALNESANLSGYHSSKFRDDSELVDEIVKDVLMRLNHVHQLNSKGLVGIEKQIARVESLLQLETAGVRIIGIYGMGKTVVAQEVYNKLCFKYEGCCFLANIRELWRRHGIFSLKKKLFSTLLGEKHLKIDIPNELPQYVEKRLRHMKVLIILDNVNDSEQLEILAGTLDWFGSGTRIIITARDNQLLAKNFVDTYMVDPLNFSKSLRLFRASTFNQSHPEIEYYELSKRVVKYAEGNPLILKVFGGFLREKGKEIWESQLERLEKEPSIKVDDVIKLSYNDLGQDEKEIFLDIACFFHGLKLKVNYVSLLLKDHDYSVDAGLERLKDKALVNISPKKIVSMHDTIQETAWQIARFEVPGSKSRLWDPDNIYQVLQYNKGNEDIRSIVIDLSRIKQLHLDPHVFIKMSQLRFLDFYHNEGSSNFLQGQGGLYFPQGLESLPNELRYLHWTHYPLESLPSNFSAENLVELNLPNSQVKKLWHEAPNLVNLNVLVLHSSTQLKELPDFSKARNLTEIGLRSCEGLVSVHPSVFSLKKLEKLDLGGCISLTSLRSQVHLESLRYLSLYGCKELKDFSVTSKNMIKLNLELTGIKELPSSIGLQEKLENLHLANTYIEKLPASIKNLTRLRHLDLRNCSELRTLPELPPSLEILDARGCVSLETVMFPSTATEQLKENKKRVAFWNCFKLDQHSLAAIEMNAQINMMEFAHKHLSTLNGAQGTYVYPGSEVPKWLEYKTTHDYLTIDLSSVLAPHSSHLGFIFCFIVPAIPHGDSVLKFKISAGEGEGEGNSINVYLTRPRHGTKSDHVYLVYDKACSRYLSSRVKYQPRLKIKVTIPSRKLTSRYVPLQLRGFGVSTINTTQYLNFVKIIGSGDGNIPNNPTLFPSFLAFCIATLIYLAIRCCK